MNPMCGVNFAAVWARAVCAGIIASSSGSPTATPAPRRNVRRDKCFLVMNIIGSLITRNLLRSPHLERRAVNDTQHDRRKLVIVLGRNPDDLPYGRHIVILEFAPQREHHHLFRKRLRKLL